MSFNIQQQKIINHYREMYNIASVISDATVVEIIKQDMIQSGKVYPGFESLVQGAVSARQSGENTGLFGFGFNNEGNLELALSNNTSQYLTLPMTTTESNAFNFMKIILQNAETTMDEREKEAGPVSAFTNFLFRHVWGNKYSKKNVKKEIKEFEKHLIEIEKATKGEKVYRDFLGNVSSVSFKDEFKKLRGVDFNAEKITSTIEKSSELANIRNCYQSVLGVKELLGYSTSGMYNITHPEEATKAILQACDVLNLDGQAKADLIGQIFEQYKDHPILKKYNCNGLTFDKNSNGEYCIYKYTDDKNGFTEAPIEIIRLITSELAHRLDKALATGLNIEFDENTSPETLSQLCQEEINKHEAEYQKMFTESFGGKDVKILSDEYVLKQQQDVATIEAIENGLGMALMLAPGGFTASSGWLLKTGKFAQTAQKMAKIGATLSSVQKVASPFIMGNMILSPTQLIEQGFSENGFSDEELEQWKTRVIQNSIYMAAGMASANIAAKCAAQYKTAKLVQALKASGKSFDEIQAMIKSNPVQFPNDIVKEFAKISKQGMYGQIGAEIAFDVSSTVALNLIMGNGTLTKTEVINSIIFAISGGAIQKQFAPLTTEAKIKFLMDNFKDFGINYDDALNILKTMDEIAQGGVDGNKRVNDRINEDNIKNIETSATKTINHTAMELPKEFASIIEKRATDLRKINEIEDTKTFYEEAYKILIEEMGISEFAPKLDFSQTHENARMEYVDSQNTLYVYKLTENRELAVGLIAHELRHFIQFKDEITTYLDNPRDGVSNLIDAKTEAHAKATGKSFDEAYVEVLGWFLDSDGDLKPHVQKIIDTYDRIDPSSEKGQQVAKYLENESHYIDKTESYSIDGTLKSYEDQITEKEAYEVSDAVATAYNKLVLGNDKTVKTRESETKISPKEATKILTEKLQNKPNIAELISCLKVFKPENSILNEMGGISFYDVNGYYYYLFCDGQGNIIKYCVTDENYNQKNYIYDKSGKATEVDVKIYNRTIPEFRLSEEKKHIIENPTLLPEETRKLILQDENHFHTKENINELSSLLKTEEDIAIANKLLMTKGSEKGYIRVIGDALNLSQQKFGVNDIIKVLKSEVARQKVLDSIKNNEYVKKTELEPLLNGEKFDTFQTHKLADENNLTYRTKDITIKNVDDVCYKYYLDSKFRNQINSQVPDGEAACINGKMYCRAGNELVPINLSKETFERLFPVEERYNIKQRELGDCYFIAELGGYLATPNGRATLYSVFNEVGDDIIIKFPKYENVQIKFENGKLNKLSPISIYTKDGKLKIGSSFDQIKACDGIKMIEQAFAFVRNIDTETESTIIVNDKFLMNKQMQNLDGGNTGETTSLYKNTEVISYFTSIGFTLDGPKTVEEALEIFAKELEKNPNVFGSIYFNKAISADICDDLVTGHQYRIHGYDTATQTVKIVNPHDSSKYFDVPLEMFEKAEPNFSIYKIDLPQSAKLKLPDFVKDKFDVKFTADDVDETITNILKFYKDNAKELKADFESRGFFDLGRAQSRLKSESSLRDKIVNYLDKHPNATHLDIWQEIRDCFACRTIIQDGDFTKHPEIIELLNKGDKKGAYLKAAELQSQEAVTTIKNLIDKNANGDKKIKAARFTNYVSKDGIPYLSENQLAEIQLYAAKKGITLDIVVKIDETDPKYHEIIQSEGKSTTRSQPSGYTALQMNFIYENGAVFEWQYRGEAVNKFAEAEHIAYDARTGKKLTGGNPKLEPLYDPIQQMLDKENMPADVYDKYNEYLNAYYYHCRLLELGFESTPPKLSDFEINGYKFDPRLEAENLMKLHDVADALKNDRISTRNAKRIMDNFVKYGIDEFVPMSKEDFAQVLKNMGYDDATIEKVKFKNECFQAEINAMLVLKETLGEDFERIDPEDLIDMSELYSGYSRVNITKHNIETLKNKLGSNFTNYDYKEILKENNIEGILKVIYEYKGEEKLSQNAINLLIWSNERALKELTPERFEAYIKIIDNVNEGFKVSARNLDLVDMLILHPEINDNKIIFDMLSNCALQLGKVGDQKNGVRIILYEVEDCVNNYSKYKDLEASDFTKTTLGLIKKLTPENQDNAIKLIEALESKLKCDYETAILITRYLNIHPKIDFADFARFVETVDFNKLTELVPDFAKYTDTDKINFLDFHYKNGTKEFTTESLTLKEDLTTFLAENYLGEELGTLLAIFPKTDRNIGTLPKGWFHGVIETEIVEKNVRFAIDDFRKAVEGCYDDENIYKPATMELGQRLSWTLGKQVDVKYLDYGSFGTGYKISVEGAEPVVLKIYHKRQLPSTKLEHGPKAEVQLGPFLNEHSDKFVHFYFGKVPDNFTKDGFVVTEFLEEGKNPTYKGNDDSNYKITSEDAWQGHNIISGTIIDYGAVRIVPEENGKFFKFENLIDKKE